MRRRVLLTEALNKSRIKKNFGSFFQEVNIEGLLDKVLERMEKFFFIILSHFSEDLEAEGIKLFKAESGIINEIPTIYIEKLFSELKTIFSNSNNKKNFLELINNVLDPTLIHNYKNWIYYRNYHIVFSIISAYTLLFFVRVFIQKNGLTLFTEKLNALEKKVITQKEYDIIDDVNNLLIEYKQLKYEKDKQSMSKRRIYEDDDIEVYKVEDSREACIILGKGTNWCVANTHDDSHYKYYSSLGDMYVFIFKKVKNRYNGQGPEKALLTLTNKITQPREEIRLKDVINKLLNKDYKVNLKLKFIDIKREDFIRLINSDVYKKILENLEFYKPSETVRRMVSYFSEEFIQFYSNRLIPPTVLYNNTTSIDKILVNNEFNNFIEYLMTYINLDYTSFISTALNESKIEARFKDVLEFFKFLINEVSLDDTRILNSIDSSIVVDLIINIDDKLKLDTNSSVNDYFNNFLKYDYHLRDSSNNWFSLIPNLNTPHYNTLLKYMMQWPGMKDIIFGDYEDFIQFETVVNDILKDVNFENKDNSFENEDDPILFKEIKYLKSIDNLYNRITNMEYLLFSFNELIKRRKYLENTSTLLKFLNKMLETKPEIAFLLYVVYESVIYLNNSFPFEVEEVYFSTLFSLIHENNIPIKDINDVIKTYSRNTFDGWKDVGFFDIEKENFDYQLESEKIDKKINAFFYKYPKTYITRSHLMVIFLEVLRSYIYNQIK